MRRYTSKVIAQWLGVTERRIRQLRDEGILTEEQHGLYDLKKSVIMYITYLRKGGKKADLNDERAALAKAKREALEMENQLRRGSMHTTEDIEQGIKTMCLNIRSRFLTLPAKLSVEIAAIEAGSGRQAEIYDKLKGAIDEVLEDLSDYNVTFAVRGGVYEEVQSRGTM